MRSVLFELKQAGLCILSVAVNLYALFLVEDQALRLSTICFGVMLGIIADLDEIKHELGGVSR